MTDKSRSPRLGRNAGLALNGGEFLRITGQRMSGNAEIDNAVLTEALNRPEYHPDSETAPLAVIEENQVGTDRIDWPRDENGLRTFETLPDEFVLDGERINKADLLRSATGGRLRFTEAASGIVTPTTEAEKQTVVNHLLAAQEAGRLVSPPSTIPAVPTATPAASCRAD